MRFDIHNIKIQKKNEGNKNQSFKFKLTKKEIAEMLKEKGISPTSQRVEIAYLLLQKPQHLSAEEILNLLNQDYERVSQATVYNTLKLFVEKNVIRELIFSSDRIYYDSNTTHHHHFLDLDTGKIFDIPACLIGDLEIHSKDMNAISIEEISILIKGRRKNNSNKGNIQ